MAKLKPKGAPADLGQYLARSPMECSTLTPTGPNATLTFYRVIRFDDEARRVICARLWTLAFGHHEDRSPTHDYAATREAAMTAFAKSWRRE
jgi:hypothetical protein